MLFITFCVIRIWCEIDAEVLGLHSLIFFGRTEIAKPETFVTRIVKMYYFHLMMRSLEIEFMQTIKIILKILLHYKHIAVLSLVSNLSVNTFGNSK